MLGLVLWTASTVCQSARPVRVAVLDLGDSPAASKAAAKIREAFRIKDRGAPLTISPEFELIDPDQSRAAALGAGYKGSLNMRSIDARDLGAAIGCDFYFLGEAQTLLRSSSRGPDYYESYATIFLVSARTGRLLHWERPEFQGATPDEAEKALLTALTSEETRNRYAKAIRRVLEDERDERAQALGGSTPVIEMMDDEGGDSSSAVRAPRPYRRLKPPYPETAARSEIEATVDVLVDIDAQGEVRRSEVVRWAGYGLDQSVTDTLRQMHFFPAMRDGVAIPMRVLLRYNFRKLPINRSQ